MTAIIRLTKKGCATQSL